MRRHLNHKTLFFLLFFFAFITIISLYLEASASDDNYMYLTIASKSMQPTLDVGMFITIKTDVLASSINAATYPNGDIIVFYKPKSGSQDSDQYVAHRAVANLTRDNGLVYFRTKGDSNIAEDSWPDYRGENYSWNGMISEKLLIGKVVSYGENFQSSNLQTIGRYSLFESNFTMSYNRTVQQLKDSGIDVQGDPTWLLHVNCTYLDYTAKITVIDIDWPDTTTRFLEGEHNTNLTGYRIMENGSIGDRVFSHLQMNQSARLGNTWTGNDPSFGVGFNPSALVIGNRFKPDADGILEYTVNRSEILTNTPWGENQTYVVDGYFANETHRFQFTLWCDAESGLILKQIVDSRTPELIAHEELRIIETGIEFVAPKREPSSPGNAAAALAVGAGISVGLSALMSASSVTQAAGQAGSKLSLREAVNRFFKFHSEKTFEERDKKDLDSSEESRRKKEIGRMVLSALVSTFAFAATFEAGDLPNLLSLSSLPLYFPVFLVSVSVITMARGLFGPLAFRWYQVRVETRIWVAGLVALIASSLIFHVPFGAPYTTKYITASKSKYERMLMILTRTTLVFALLLIFSLPLLSDLTALGGTGEFLFLAGDAGVLIVTMTVFFSLLPAWPLDGKILWDCSKRVWLIAIMPTGTFFVCYIFELLTPMLFLIAGIVSLCIFLITWYLARRGERARA